MDAKTKVFGRAPKQVTDHNSDTIAKSIGVNCAPTAPAFFLVKIFRRTLWKMDAYVKNPGSRAEGVKGAGARAAGEQGNGRKHPDTDMSHVTV